MCGICGIYHPHGQPVSTDILHSMNATLHHRGPDGEGYYVKDAVGLAMRRLRIIDLAGSEQPLSNETQTLRLVFNGEIYNYRALRSHLIERGHILRTGGDGETILHLYEEHGLVAPCHLRGQFAFALWDNDTKRLILARDITGEKPLYVYHHAGLVVWGSELKAILRHPDINAASCMAEPRLLAHYLTHGYLAEGRTPYQHIQAVLPGHIVTIDRHGLRSQAYWTAPISQPAQASATEEAMLPRLREALENAVDLTMSADVPLGAFLSGGLDSSLIVAMMQRRSSQPIRTFSIGFEGDDSFDETPYARQVAALLGTQHTEFRINPTLLDLLPDLVRHYDMPFGDSSALPTYLVSQQTRQHVTVALTGDGGDELFAGYERFYALSLIEKMAAVPRSLWRVMNRILERLPEGTGYYNPVKRGRRFVRSASLPLDQAYLDLVRVFTTDQIWALIGYSHAETLPIATSADALSYNLTTYLPGDLLVKTDRMSMAVSLETRSPFLFQEVLELAFAMPFNLKLRGRTTKAILKTLARDYLPSSIVDRPKHGFGVPLGAWLRRDASSVRDLLLGSDNQCQTLLDVRPVRDLLDAHTQGRRDESRRLWALLTLEVWLRQQ